MNKRPRKDALLNVAAWMTTGLMVVSDPETVVGYFVARLAVLATKGLQNAQQSSTQTEIQDRITALEAAETPTRTIRGNALRLLGVNFQKELSELFGQLTCDEAMRSLNINATEHREAAEELELVGLVTIHPSGNAPAGVHATTLTAGAYFAVGPMLLLEIDVLDETYQVLQTIGDLENDRTVTRTTAVAELHTDIPLPRRDLILKGLEASGLIRGSYQGHPDYGSFFSVALTTAGKRVLRGDDPLVG